MDKLSRRNFLGALGVGGAAAVPRLLSGAPAATKVKPVSGSWFEFQHAGTAEGVNWNPACVCFTCEQWQAKVKEIADIGMEYLVLMSTALYYRAFYRTPIFPQWQLRCTDPIEAVLSAADQYGVKFFVGGGFYGDWASPVIIADPAAAKRRLRAIEELARLYGHHRSFYGWYWPNEAFIDRYYSHEFIRYVNACSRLARQLTPRARILIAPYGTRVAVPDEKYVKQLESMDVDIIAYQDEVGVEKSKVTETSAFYEGLRKAHDRVPKVAIWADVEIFKFEGKVYGSALLPAPFDRVRKQLAAVSPWVEEVLVYQYQGMMNKPGSRAFAGPPDSVKLYTDYVSWLRRGR
ncbi:MAG: DUF4434 domain-containing protein [Terriglobia bacterium]